MGIAESSESRAISSDMDRFTTYTIRQVLKLKDRLNLITEEYGVTKVQFATITQCREAEAETLFKIFDRENKGRVDAYEFLCALFLICQAPLVEKAEMIFKLYDFDGNLYITRDELIIMLMSTLSALAHMTDKPLPTVKETQDFAFSVMKSSDVNNDKRISLSEFLCYVTKNKALLRVLAHYNLITKDDFRPNFGWTSEDLPDCDSDLENEVLRKGAEKRSVNYDLLEHPLIDKSASISIKTPAVVKNEESPLISRLISTKKTLENEPELKEADAESPDANLELEYIHGYRCMDTRNNIRYNKEGDIVYHTASVGIVLNQGLNTQKHFLEHTSEIVCLAMHPNMIYIATGDVGPVPKICIWDSTTMECLARISGLLKKGISHLCFSSDGNYLAASAMDEYHCIAIYDWDKCTTTSKNVANRAKKSMTNALVATGQVTSASILSLLFNPSGDQLIAPAVNELNFISFAGGVIKVQKGECPEQDLNKKRVDKQALLCAAYVGTTLVTGCFNGELLAWKGKKLSHCVEAHNGCVNTIWPRPNLAGIITGSNDGTIKIWDQSLKELKPISLIGDPRINSIIPKIRSVCESADGNILVGTRSGEIIEITKNTPKVLIRSHSKNELWGLAVHPRKAEYVTLSRDNILAVWDIVTRKQKLLKKIDCGGDVVAFSLDGKLGAMGLINGQVMIFDGDSYETIATRKDTKSSILELKFAPNGNTITVSATDSCIYVYDTTKKFKLAKKLKAQSPITHIDYSEDSECIQTTSTLMNHSCYSLEKGKKVENAASIKWATYTCPTGSSISGVCEYNSSRDTVKAVDRLTEGTVLSTGDSLGLVKLFKFPCPIEQSSYRAYKGHSGIVSNVKFSPDKKYLISIGATDKSIFQWRFTKDERIETLKPEQDVLVDEPLEMDIRKEELVPQPASPAKTLLKDRKPDEDKKSPGRGADTKSVYSESDMSESGKKRRLISDIAHSQPKEFQPSKNSVFLLSEAKQ